MPAEENLWNGLATNLSPHLVPRGATVSQDNCAQQQIGVLSCRRGIVPITYSSVSPADTVDCISICKFDTPPSKFLVYERADGSVKAIRNGGSATIKSSLNTAQPLCWLRTRKGYLIAVNGIDQGILWDGQVATAYPLGMAAPAAGPSISSSGAGGGAEAGDYVCAFRYKDADGNYSAMSPLTTRTATASQQFDWSSITAGSEARAVSKELWRSTVGESDVLYLVTTIANATTTYTDTTTDATLLTSTALPILTEFNTLNARRQVPPPTNKPFIAQLQDRVFYYGNVIYTTGTVAVTNGSATVTGTSTAWTSQMVGRLFYIPGQTAKYTVQAVGSATSITLTSNYGGSTTSGLSYAIGPELAEQRLLYWSAEDEPESVPDENSAPIQENTGDHDLETGLMSYNSALYLLHERHIYRATFASQPDMDLSVRLAANRGCINNRSWVIAVDTAYMMDQYGIFAFSGGSIDPISEPIQNLWYDGTLDFSKSSKWFAEYEPAERSVKFYVTYAADSSTYPMRAICYHVPTRTWSTESYVWEIGHACRQEISGVVRLILAAEDDRILIANEGLTDLVTTAVTGSVTSATSTTISDSGATPFLSSQIGASIVITAGTGKGQVRKITSINSATQAVVATWTTTPDSTSRYAIGGVSWIFKTGTRRFKDSKGVAQPRSMTLSYAGTTNAATLDFRRYLNHETTAANWAANFGEPDGIDFDVNGPNAVLNLLKTQFQQGTDPGYKDVPYDGARGGNLADRWLALEFRGFQTKDRIQLYSMEWEGVE